MNTMEAIRRMVCPDDVSCMLCGEERGMGGGTGLCDKCNRELVTFDGERSVQKAPLYAAYVYQSAAAKLIHGLKYENKRYMALPLILGLTRVYTEKGIAADGIIPVPLHKKRQRMRGYNQSEILAAGLCERVHAALWRNVLLRVRDTSQQVGLLEHERLQNVKDAFACSVDLHGKHVVLLDDVCTTGATLSACMLALEAQGAAVTLLAAATVDTDVVL